MKKEILWLKKLTAKYNPLTRPAATLSTPGGERDGARGV